MGVSVVQAEGGVQPDGDPHPVTHPGHLPHLGGTEINIRGCELGTGGGWSPAGWRPTPRHPPRPFAGPRYRKMNVRGCERGTGGGWSQPNGDPYPVTHPGHLPDLGTER